MTSRPKPAGDQAITAEQLATLSHEFRTPLNGVLGMARLLDGTRLTAEQRAYVAALKESGTHLLSLVNDVLDLARLGSTRLELDPGPMTAGELLRQVCELLSPRAHEKGVEIAWAVDPGLPPFVADAARLRQVLLNFAGNAIKFTTTGGVLLTAGPDAEGAVRFTVTDTGPGVDQAQRERIFEPFVQAEAAHAIVLGGAGLGLAIVRRLAEAMAARVGVEAGQIGDRPAGAEFWFAAPFPRLAAETPSQPLVGLTVGVASPNRVVREAAARQIRSGGGLPVTAPDLTGLLAQVPADAVLLLDHALVEGRRALRPAAGRRCIVLLTPEQRDRIARNRAAGFSGYLIKPLRPTSLAERVLAALEPDAIAPDAPAPVEDERAAPAAAPGSRVLLAEDNPINALLARTLLEREGCQVDRAMSGEEALAALASGVYDLILMDLRMPGLGGMEAARALRQRGVTTPVVALTADAFEDDRRACLAAGMNDFLVKPLTPDALRAVLSRWVGWTEASAKAKVAS